MTSAVTHPLPPSSLSPWVLQVLQRLQVLQARQNSHLLIYNFTTSPHPPARFVLHAHPFHHPLLWPCTHLRPVVSGCARRGVEWTTRGRPTAARRRPEDEGPSTDRPGCTRPPPSSTDKASTAATEGLSKGNVASTIKAILQLCDNAK